ncbi:hypothetical protein F5Y03DRAFT_167005 [Xylaria venustula]|nr:hypothetical protein F5Y03DRAFT_167005 [Xylaria venustula]
MCVNSYQHFTKCDHVSKTLTTCPTYHKQQATAKGFFGSLFRRNLKKMKNCGKVVPHHLQVESYCQACSVKKGRLRAVEVGQGALKVHRQGFQEIFQAERKEAARNALQRSEKRRHRTKQSNHEVLHVQSSVWLDDLYHHPETLARREAYAREAALAPPISRHRARDNAPRAVEPRQRGPKQERHRVKNSEAGRGEYMPTYGGSQPIIRPVQPAPTHKYTGRFANNSPGLPPAVGLPPRPRYSDSSIEARAEEASGYPELKRKPARIDKPSSKNPHHWPGSPYSIYHTRAPTAAELQEMILQEEQHPKPSKTHVEHRRKEVPSRRGSKKSALSSFIEKARERTSLGDDDSDVSFVCQTSRAISDQQPRHKGERRRHRK